MEVCIKNWHWYLQVAGHSQPCRRSVAGDQRWASPWKRKERMRQLVPSDLVGSRQPHSLSWAVRWVDQHKHAKAPNKLKKPQELKMNLTKMKKLKRTNNKHNHHPPCHNPHYNKNSSPPQSLHGSDQFPWTPSNIYVPQSCSTESTIQ